MILNLTILLHAYILYTLGNDNAFRTHNLSNAMLNGLTYETQPNCRFLSTILFVYRKTNFLSEAPEYFGTSAKG